MTPTLTHISLHVRDLEACIGFYREFCGLEIVHQREDGGTRVVWLAEPGRAQEVVFVLLPGGPGRDGSGFDLCIECCTTYASHNCPDHGVDSEVAHSS